MSASFINPVVENKAWSSGDIARRADQLIRGHIRSQNEQELTRKVLGLIMGDYPFSAKESTELAEFSSSSLDAQASRRLSEAANAALILALNYEQAQRDLQAANVLLDGVPEVPEVEAVEGVDAVVDELTGEVITPAIEAVEYAALIPAIEPLALTVESFDEAGEPITIDNPAYITQRDKRDNAQTVIDGASADTLALITEREAYRNGN